MQRRPLADMPVPFLDLRPSHVALRERLLRDLGDVIDRSAFVNGPEVARFEQAFAGWCGAAHCVGVASGLDALRLALLAAGLPAGGRVIVPASTFAATAEAVLQAGLEPVIVDVGEDDYCLDPAAAAAAVDDRTCALLPVHLYGQMADVAALDAVARRHGLTLVEDACQAHGAARGDDRPGSRGQAAAFSFYPGKNLGAFGDAGALITGDAALADRVRALREHGQRVKHQHDEVGYTSRLDTLQAVVLLHKLRELDRWTEERRAAAARYTAALAGVGDLVLPPVPAGSRPVWHLYVIRTARPVALQEALAARGIQTARHYPVAIHAAPAFAAYAPRGALPVAEALAREAVSLPLYPGITEAQQEAVVDAVAAYFRG